MVSLSALTENLDASLDLFADVALNPAFPAPEFERLQKQQLAASQAEKAEPFQMALRVFPRLIYGEGHAYGTSFTGSRTEARLSKITVADLDNFHRTWFTPSGAMLVVVGDTTLGGMFTSRINMNLREDKHWSYGAQSTVAGARGQRPFLVIAPVETDKTKESMREIDRELRDVGGQRPLSAEELTKAQSNLTLSLPGSLETANDVALTVSDMVRYGLPDDYYATYPGKVRALTLPDVAEAAKTLLQPDRIIWVVVGDRSTIEGGIKELGIGEIRLIDAGGNPVSN